MTASIETAGGVQPTLSIIYTDDDDLDGDLRAFLPATVLMPTERTRTLPPSEDPLAWLRKMAADSGIEEGARHLAADRLSAGSHHDSNPTRTTRATTTPCQTVHDPACRQRRP